QETKSIFIDCGQDQIEIPGSRGEANFVWKCRSCGKAHTALIRNSATAYDSIEGERKNIIELDCRGLEPTDFIADGEWLATGSESATPFSGIDLGEGEWYDYDEKAGDEVSITDLEWEIKRM
ncbi:hypothetical protein KEM55_002932, partial [Ascosphaera atra]